MSYKTSTPFHINGPLARLNFISLASKSNTTLVPVTKERAPPPTAVKAALGAPIQGGACHGSFRLEIGCRCPSLPYSTSSMKEDDGKDSAASSTSTGLEKDEGSGSPLGLVLGGLNGKGAEGS